MKTLLANLAAKLDPEDQLTGVKRWLFLRGDAIRYALAPAAVAIAFLARVALTPLVGDASPYLLFTPAVLVASGLGGLGPGLLATALSVLLGFFVVTISPTTSVAESVNAALFAVIGAGIAWSGELLQRNRIQAANSTREALAREALIIALAARHHLPAVYAYRYVSRTEISCISPQYGHLTMSAALIESAQKTGAPDPRVVSIMTRSEVGTAWVDAREPVFLLSHSHPDRPRPALVDARATKVARKWQNEPKFNFTQSPICFSSQAVSVQRSRSARFRLDNARRS